MTDQSIRLCGGTSQKVTTASMLAALTSLDLSLPALNAIPTFDLIATDPRDDDARYIRS